MNTTSNPHRPTLTLALALLGWMGGAQVAAAQDVTEVIDTPYVKDGVDAERLEHLELFSGVMAGHDGLTPNFGLDFAHHLTHLVSVGAMVDHAMTGETLIAPLLLLHPTHNLRFGVAPGADLDPAHHHTSAALRLSAGYALHFGHTLVGPEASVEWLSTGDTLWSCGVGTGVEF